MENIDLTQMVHDRRAEREADAHDHRLTRDTGQPPNGVPRLRYQRRHRPVEDRTESRAAS
jgi:hypothetical protein